MKSLLATVLFLLSAPYAYGVLGGKNLWIPSDADEDLVKRATVRLVILKGNEFVPYCSGVAWGPGEIISAGHCFHWHQEDLDAKVIFAEFFDPNSPNKMKRIRISKVKFREDSEGDLALAKLTEDAPIKQSVPVAFSDCDPDSPYYSSGFGRDESNRMRQVAKVANMSRLNMSSLDLDAQEVNEIAVESDNWVIFQPGNGTPCSGDSGGPVFCKVQGKLSLAAVYKGRDIRASTQKPASKKNVDMANICRKFPFRYGSRIGKFQQQISNWRSELEESRSSAAVLNGAAK